MAEKDNWDKYDIIMKTIVLGVIPFVINHGFNEIAQSLKKAELVNSLIPHLVDSDNSTKRDIALITLHYAIPAKKCDSMKECGEVAKDDEVLDIARALMTNAITNGKYSEIKVAADICKNRISDKFYEKSIYPQLFEKGKQSASSVDPENDPQKDSKENIAKAMEVIQPSLTPKNTGFEGIRLVYIQYDADINKAKKIQEYLKEEINSSVAPGIEHVRGITANSIRYANSGDLEIAKKLQGELSKMTPPITIKDNELIDLSPNYKVPSGQLEIWLKDGQ
jgi:hypothetical protein